MEDASLVVVAAAVVVVVVAVIELSSPFAVGNVVAAIVVSAVDKVVMLDVSVTAVLSLVLDEVGFVTAGVDLVVVVGMKRLRRVNSAASTVSIEPPPLDFTVPTKLTISVSSTEQANRGPGSWSCTPILPGIAANASSNMVWFCNGCFGEVPNPIAPVAFVLSCVRSLPFSSTSTRPLP